MLTPDKIAHEIRRMAQQLQEDLMAMISGQWDEVNPLVKFFSHLTDKEQAWEGLLALTKDKDRKVQINAIIALSLIFPVVFDKQRAWEDLLALTKDKESDVRSFVACILRQAFPHVTNKEQAWYDLLTLIMDEEIFVGWFAAEALGSAFPLVTDKEQALEDLLALLTDKTIMVGWRAAEALSLAFPHITDKERVTKTLLALTKDEHSGVRSIAAYAFGSVFPHLTDKEQATKTLLALTKDKDSDVRSSAAYAFGSVFPHLTDKEQATKTLLILTKDKDSDVRSSAAYVFGSVFPYLTDKEQATKALLILTKDKNKVVRWSAATSFSKLARYYINEKKYEKTYQYFYNAASAFKYSFWEYIRPNHHFFLYKGLGLYYHGRALVSGLSEIETPKKFIENLKDAIILFNKSIKNIEKFPYEYEAQFLPICFNVYSAYFEYNLSLQKLDEKSVTIIQNYLNDASKQCEIVGSEKGKNIVIIFEKLTETLKSRINEINLETQKRDASKKGKGVGERGTLDTFIKKSRKDFEKHINELDNLLDELEIPIIKKIIEFEKERLEEIKTEKEEILKPKPIWLQKYDFIKKIWKEFWKEIVAIALILSTIAEIAKNWDFILNLLKF